MEQTPQRPEKKKPKKRTWLKVLIWLAVIAVAAFLILFIAAKIGQFEDIPAMLRYIDGQF